MQKKNVDDIYNCILGGAIGDALGSTVNDMTYDLIVEQYGKTGLTDMEKDCDGKARLTANTQLTIFTIDAIIRAYTKYRIYGFTNLGKTISYTGYLRWQYNQDRKVPDGIDPKMLSDNYLMDIQELKYERFAESNMKQVLENEMLNDDMENTNNNKGYAAVTKAAPFGLVFYQDDELAFEMAVKVARLTHGYPSAYLSAGAMAVIIANIVRGEKIEVAIDNAIAILKKQKTRANIIDKITIAKTFAKDKIHYPEKFDDFGLCDDSEEALAAAIYVCLVYPKNMEKALLFAVNNNCYSSNIATLVGQILGLYNGLDIKMLDWAKRVELFPLFKDLAYDLSFVVDEKMPTDMEVFEEGKDIGEIKDKWNEDIANWWLLKYDKD